MEIEYTKIHIGNRLVSVDEYDYFTSIRDENELSTYLFYYENFTFICEKNKKKHYLHIFDHTNIKYKQIYNITKHIKNDNIFTGTHPFFINKKYIEYIEFFIKSLREEKLKRILN